MKYYQRSILSKKSILNNYNYKGLFQIYSVTSTVKDHFEYIVEYDFNFFKNYHLREFNGPEDLVDAVFSQIFINDIIHILTIGSGLRFQLKEETIFSNRIEKFTIPKDLTGELDRYNCKKFDPRFEEFLHKLFSTNKPDLEIMKSSLYWYYQGNHYTMDFNLNFISLTNSIEALCKIEFPHSPEICNECSQPKYGVTSKFIKFLKKYSGDSRSKTKQNKLYSEIYKLRSELVHNGTLFQSRLELFINKEDFKHKQILLGELSTLSRNAIINFGLN